MNWILIAITTGMLMTSSHDTEEACLGRKAILEKDKVINSKCVDMKAMTYNVTHGSYCLTPNGYSTPCSVK